MANFMNDDMVCLLRQNQLLQLLNQKEFSSFVKKLSIEHYKKDQFIFRRGDFNSDVYFLLKGSVRSLNFTADGGQIFFRERKAGDYFGYYAGFSGGARTADMLALKECTVASINGEVFLDIIAHHPLLARQVIKDLTDIVRDDTQRITQRSGMSAHQRICFYLLKYVSRKGEFERLPSGQAIADYLDVTRETVSRTFSELIAQKILKKHGRQMQILDLGMLQEQSRLDD